MRVSLIVLAMLLVAVPITAQETAEIPAIAVVSDGETCPLVDPLRPPPPYADFSAEGVILTAFDASEIWHVDVTNGRRYPIFDSVPCNRGCHLAPDGQHFVYFNDATNTHSIMRLDGAEREVLTNGAIDVMWWPDGQIFAWTPDTRAFLLRDAEKQYIAADDLTSIAPGGVYGIVTRFNGETFERRTVEVGRRVRPGVSLGEDLAYFNDYAWSPDGRTLAYVAPSIVNDAPAAELYLLALDNETPRQITELTEIYGPSRINGISVSALAWSPDGARIAFWVLPRDGSENAQIHIYDTRDDSLRAYCDFSTPTHTPNTPRLIWSPDSDDLALAADLDNNGYGALLLTLNANSGMFTTISEGVYGVYGIADVYLWGIGP